MKMIKVDFLGLGMMAVMKDCIDLVPKHYGVSIDLGQLSHDDLVYEMLRMADTIGLFQVESPAQMSALVRNLPKVFYDLVVQVALIRPGPIVGKMANPYMLRRQAGSRSPTRIPCSNRFWNARWEFLFFRNNSFALRWSSPIFRAEKPKNCAGQWACGGPEKRCISWKKS